MSMSVVMVTTNHLSDSETVSEVVEWIISIVLMDLQLGEGGRGRVEGGWREEGKAEKQKRCVYEVLFTVCCKLAIPIASPSPATSAGSQGSCASGPPGPAPGTCAPSD